MTNDISIPLTVSADADLNLVVDGGGNIPMTVDTQITQIVGGDYEDLINKPKINGVELDGDLSTGEIGITIPENVSELANDAGYITASDIPVTSVNGLTGDVSVTVPTKTSDLENDSGFITDPGVASFNGQTGAVTYTAPVTSVNGQTGAVSLSIPTVPTNVSAFNNDAGYLTLATLPIYDGGIE